MPLSSVALIALIKSPPNECMRACVLLKLAGDIVLWAHLLIDTSLHNIALVI
jgi:hypothetical protein